MKIDKGQMLIFPGGLTHPHYTKDVIDGTRFQFIGQSAPQKQDKTLCNNSSSFKSLFLSISIFNSNILIRFLPFLFLFVVSILTIGNVSKISKDLSNITSSLTNSDLDITIANFKKSSDDLSSILSNINKGQGTISKLIVNDSLFNNLNEASRSIDLLLEDIRLNPNRYIHFSLFGKKEKPYNKEEN